MHSDSENIRKIASSLARQPLHWGVTYDQLRRTAAMMFTAPMLERLDSAGLDPVQDVALPLWFKVGQILPELLTDFEGVKAVSRVGHDVIASALNAIEFGETFQQALNDRLERLTQPQGGDLFTVLHRQVFVRA